MFVAGSWTGLLVLLAIEAAIIVATLTAMAVLRTVPGGPRDAARPPWPRSSTPTT